MKTFILIFSWTLLLQAKSANLERSLELQQSNEHCKNTFVDANTVKINCKPTKNVNVQINLHTRGNVKFTVDSVRASVNRPDSPAYANHFDPKLRGTDLLNQIDHFSETLNTEMDLEKVHAGCIENNTYLLLADRFSEPPSDNANPKHYLKLPANITDEELQDMLDHIKIYKPEVEPAHEDCSPRSKRQGVFEAHKKCNNNYRLGEDLECRRIVLLKPSHRHATKKNYKTKVSEKSDVRQVNKHFKIGSFILNLTKSLNWIVQQFI